MDTHDKFESCVIDLFAAAGRAAAAGAAAARLAQPRLESAVLAPQVAVLPLQRLETIGRTLNDSLEVVKPL